MAVLAGGWAWWVPTPDPSAPAGGAGAKSATAKPEGTIAAITPASWNVNLWRGTGDDTVTTAPTGNLPLKLYSVMQDGADWTAAVAAGDGGALQFVKAGDSCNGFTVVRVEATGVVLRQNGQEQRLGLGP